MKEDCYLICQLNKGSRIAFSSLYDKYVGMIYGYAYSVLKDNVMAEDITQFCFMQLWERKEAISPHGNLPAWLYVIAKNAVFKELRHQLTASRYIDNATRTSDRFQNASAGKVDVQIIDREINSFIDSLPEARRRIFVMRAFKEMSVAEIAEALGISPKTVETQLHRSYTALRAAISKIIFLVLLAIFDSGL